MFKLFRNRRRSSEPSMDWNSWRAEHELIMRWVATSGKERVYAVRRLDGVFSFVSEEFSEDEHELCWVPVEIDGDLFDSLDTAIREIHATFPWTRDTEPELPERDEVKDGRGTTSA